MAFKQEPIVHRRIDENGDIVLQFPITCKDNVEGLNEVLDPMIEEVNKFTINVAYIDSFVVETYINGTEWYRVYNNGWTEQGGYSDGSGYNAVTVTLLKPMADANYTALAVSGSGQRVGDSTNSAYNLTTTTFQSYQHGAHRWYACGLGAT